MRMAIVEAENILARATTAEVKAETKKVYEALKYSDPMSNSTLLEIDVQIEKQFIAFADAIKTEDIDLAKEIAKALIELIEKRNQKCKLLK